MEEKLDHSIKKMNRYPIQMLIYTYIEYVDEN